MRNNLKPICAIFAAAVCGLSGYTASAKTVLLKGQVSERAATRLEAHAEQDAEDPQYLQHVPLGDEYRYEQINPDGTRQWFDAQPNKKRHNKLKWLMRIGPLHK